MRILRPALAGLFYTAFAAIAPAAESPLEPTRDGPWHGSFFCYHGGNQAPRSAEFGFVVTTGTGETTAKMDQIGQLALKVSFDGERPAALSLKAESGESYLPPLEVTTELTSDEGAWRWTGRWQLYYCRLALAPGALPADAEVVAPNDPEGKSTLESSPRRTTQVAAPNDPEARTPLTSAGNSGPAPAGRNDPAVIEVAFWETVKDARDPEEFRAYLHRYPDGAFAELAKIRLARLESK